ncbi:hypothetical protein N7450_004289 [Penicillium hetheringtonii]|uniref:Serine/threonine-protein kinase ATG1 n=1 Tax=Penicillium hetheringtonii TaxID=911720 RepID=A0AAD6DPQ0_9EURO|nr:hypothetical protein N7450_004289 [Penicillium hetheringtonii]
MQPALPDLVADTRFRVKFGDGSIQRFTFRSSTLNGKYVRREEKADEWKGEKELGRGTYGSVWLHRCLTSEGPAELQAVKKVNKRSLSNAGISYVKELETIAKFSQAKYRGLFVEYYGWLLSQNMKRGRLHFKLQRVLENLHENKYVHRDIKPENIFVVQGSPDWSVKIGDFGFSKRMTEGSYLQSRVGTELYLAPEVKDIFPPEMEGTSATFSFSEKIDIWSLGILTFYMVFHEHPFTFKKPRELRKYIDGGPFPFPTSSPQQISQDCVNFISSTLARAASERLSAHDALDSDWMKQRSSEISSGLNDLKITTDSPSISSDSSSQDERDSPPPRKPAKEPSHNANLELPSKRAAPQKRNSALKNSTSSWIRSLFTTTSKSRSEDSPSPPPQKSTRKERQRYDGDPGFEASDKYFKALDLIGADDPGAAVPLLRDALSTQQGFLGYRHDSTLETHFVLARTIFQTGDYEESEALFIRTVKYRKDVYGSNSEKTFEALQWLGIVQDLQHKCEEALVAFKEALKGREILHGPEHPFTCEALKQVGRTLLNLERPIEAEKIFLRLIKIQQNTLGRTHKDTLETLRRLASSYYRQGRFDDALAAYARLLKRQGGARKSRNPEILDCMQWMGILYYKLSDFGNAENILRMTAAGHREAFGLGHEETLRSLWWLAISLNSQKKYDDEIEVRKSIVGGKAKLLGETHAETFKASDELEAVYEKARKR